MAASLRRTCHLGRCQWLGPVGTLVAKLGNVFAALLMFCTIPCSNAQAQNLRFLDEDTDANQIGGTVYWERPTAGDYGYVYAVFAAQDTAGVTKTAVPGASPLNLLTPHEGHARDTNAFVIPMNTAYGGYTDPKYLIVYMSTDAGTTLSNPAVICLLDNEGGAYEGLKYQYYIAVIGFSNANSVRSIVSALPGTVPSTTNCFARYHAVTVEMVATAIADTGTGGTAIIEAPFDDVDEQSSTATWLVTFPSQTLFATVKSAISAQIGTAPFPPVAVGDPAYSTDTSLSNGWVQFYTRMDSFVPSRPDPDIARYFARSCTHFRVGSPVIVTRDGWVRVQTVASDTGAVDKMANVWLGLPVATAGTVTWTTGFDGDSLGHITSGSSGAVGGNPVCHQITGAHSQQSCTSGAPV